MFYAKIRTHEQEIWYLFDVDFCFCFLTHLAPDRPSPPALFPYRETPDRPVAAGKQTLHTSISAYANRNGILARLVALFLLLFTTSGDVVCLKFGEV